jgi:hypothetical protein
MVYCNFRLCIVPENKSKHVLRHIQTRCLTAVSPAVDLMFQVALSLDTCSRPDVRICYRDMRRLQLVDLELNWEARLARVRDGLCWTDRRKP